MKRVLLLTGLFGAAVLLLATPGSTHKVDWCHFPPGQHGAKFLLLSIDEAADGSVGGQHLNHPFDGPVCISAPGAPATQVINGVTYDCADIKIPNVTALGPGCGGGGCAAVTVTVSGTPVPITLVPCGVNGGPACQGGAAAGTLTCPATFNGVTLGSAGFEPLNCSCGTAG